MNDKLITPQHTADKLQVTLNTLYNWRVQKKNLPFIKIGKLIRYRDKDVEAFIASQMVDVEVEK